MSLRVMLDSNGFDDLSLDDSILAAVERAVVAGDLDLVVTHIQEDEVAATPDDERRARLLALTTSPTPTAGFVLDVSRLGRASLGSEEEAEIYSRVSGEGHGNANDALILTTALRDSLPVVTNDKGLIRHCQRYGVATMSSAEVLERIRHGS